MASPESMGNMHERRQQANEAMTRVDSDLVRHYQPELLGAGGEHGVFLLPDLAEPTERKHRGYVAKVNHLEIIQRIKDKLARGESLDEVTEEDARDMEQLRSRHEADYLALKSYFGEAIPRQFRYVTKVPITEEMLAILKTEYQHLPKLPPGTHEVLAVVRFQKRAPEVAMNRETSAPLRNEYVEETEIDPVLYIELNMAFLDGGEPLSPLDTFREVAGRPETAALLEAAQTDPELHAFLKAFVSKAMAFSHEKGDILDFIGEDNVRVYRDKEKVRLLILDTLPSRNRIAEAREVLKQVMAGRDSYVNKIGYASVLMNTLNYTRFINGMAMCLGMTDRLTLSDDEIAPASMRILDYIRRYFPVNSGEVAELVTTELE